MEFVTITLSNVLYGSYIVFAHTGRPFRRYFHRASAASILRLFRILPRALMVRHDLGCSSYTFPEPQRPVAGAP